MFLRSIVQVVVCGLFKCRHKKFRPYKLVVSYDGPERYIGLTKETLALSDSGFTGYSFTKELFVFGSNCIGSSIVSCVPYLGVCLPSSLDPRLFCLNTKISNLGQQRVNRHVTYVSMYKESRNKVNRSVTPIHNPHFPPIFHPRRKFLECQTSLLMVTYFIINGKPLIPTKSLTLFMF